VNIVVGFCFLLLVALVALPFAAGFWRLFRETSQGGHNDLGLLLSLVFLDSDRSYAGAGWNRDRPGFARLDSTPFRAG